MMKKKVKMLLGSIAMLVVQGCAPAKDYGFMFSVYVDYEELRAAGCKVYETNVPDGYKAAGHLREIVRFPRNLVRNDDLPTYTVRKKEWRWDGSFSGDKDFLHKLIVDVVKDKGAKGIANLSVTSTISENPYFVIEGTLFK